jgi:hypothetical protein
MTKLQKLKDIGLLGAITVQDRNYGLPGYVPEFEEVAKQMRINADCIMQEITDHVDKEIKRFKHAMLQMKRVDNA